MSDYRGLVGSGDAAIPLGGRARLDLSGEQDIVYSIETTTPYYVATGATAVITRRFGVRWDLVGRAGGQRLDYQLAPELEPDSRVDRWTLVGGGVGYYAGRDLRIGLDVNREQRHTQRIEHPFVGYTMGVSATVGTPASRPRLDRARP